MHVSVQNITNKVILKLPHLLTTLKKKNDVHKLQKNLKDKNPQFTMFSPSPFPFLVTQPKHALVMCFLG